MEETTLELKSDFVVEVLDLAQVHLVWTSRHLQEGRRDQGLAAFQKLVICVRGAATEMAAMRTIIDGQKLIGQAAVEYRAQRPSSRSAA